MNFWDLLAGIWLGLMLVVLVAHIYQYRQAHYDKLTNFVSAAIVFIATLWAFFRLVDVSLTF